MIAMSEAKNPFYNRVLFVSTGLAVLAVALIMRLGYWQIIEHTYFVGVAEQRHHREITLSPTRGSIFDRNNHLLAVDTTQYIVDVSPEMLDDPAETAERLYRLLNISNTGVSREQFLEKLSGDLQYYPLTRMASKQAGETLQEWNIKGITITPRSKRAYPEKQLAAHLLGFVNDNNDGFYGIEGYYDKFLKGVAGKRTGALNDEGQTIPMGNFQYVPPVPGSDLFLSIDRTIQQMVEDELAQAIDRYGAEKGTVIILQPKTGAILALANWPTYNPNDFSATEDNRFINPAVSEPYEPGSVFKAITMVSALDDRIISPGTTIFDSGSIEVGGQVIYNADRQAHGTVDMTTVLAKSLNVGSVRVAQMLGEEKFYNYVRRFGFGRLIEVDLNNENPGTVLTPFDTYWYDSALATNSFGQGIAVTPIQMITAMGAIANNGLLMKPYVVQKIVSHDTQRVIPIQPEVIRRTVSADAANVLTQMLVTALETEESPALIPGYRVAGKTGTAQIPIPGGYHPTLTITSFAGYFPADNPQAVILVILHKPKTSQWGTQTAAPTFRRIGERLATLMSIPPDTVRLAQTAP